MDGGKKLGKVKDIRFSLPEGNISAIVVGGGMFGCGGDEVIRFCRIEKVGEDAILVARGRETPAAPPFPQKGCPPHPSCPPHQNCPPVEPPQGAKPCPPKPPKEGVPPFPRFDDEDYE